MKLAMAETTTTTTITTTTITTTTTPDHMQIICTLLQTDNGD